MASIPVDLKEVFSASTAATKQQAETIRVSIFVDTSAEAELITTVKKAFSPQSANAYLHVFSLDDAGNALDSEKKSDLAIVICADDPAATCLSSEMHNAGIPTCTVAHSLAQASKNSERSGYPLVAVDIIPFCKEEGDAIDPEFLYKLGKWIASNCSSKRLAFANAFSFVRKPIAVEITNSTAMQNGAVGAVLFIPGADMPVMTLNQIKMILQIAAAYGQTLGIERVKELAAVVGGGFALRTVARELVAVVPGWGWAVKAGVGYSGTVAMGRAAIEYFESGGSVAGLGSRVVSARNKVMAKLHNAKDTLGGKRLNREEIASFVGKASEKAKGVVGAFSIPSQSEDCIDAAPIVVEPLEVFTINKEGSKK